MEHKSIVGKKSYDFALSIIELYKELISNNKEYVLSKQVIRSGTSIGANINEALAAESKKDFVHKLSIAVKEARETYYWLNLLKDSKYITAEKYNELGPQCDELIKMLNSIILTTKEKYLQEDAVEYLSPQFNDFSIEHYENIFLTHNS
ncbi:MAG: four helix bundle protein [Bacteroidetes bacterium]|nr:four helix bundle protein [Bacteroidota bacterium]MBK9541710.1 four helix bundle protein [Bacteroidota bacterium]